HLLPPVPRSADARAHRARISQRMGDRRAAAAPRLRHARQPAAHPARAPDAGELPRVPRGAGRGGRAAHHASAARDVPAVPRARRVGDGSLRAATGRGEAMTRALTLAASGVAALGAAVLLLAACQREPVSPPVLKITEHAEAANPNAGLSSERFIGDAPRVEVTDFP